MKNNIVITGSSGFIGRYLINVLREKYNIIELDLKNGVDIRKWNSLTAVSHFKFIIHLAAYSYVPDSFKNPYDFYFNNYLSTLNILELARRNKAKVIFLSSYLYGSPKYLPIDEIHPLSPHNPYAQSKLICEKLCEGYFRDFGLPITIFRPFNIYGKGQNDTFLIPSIIKQIDNGIITLKDPRPKRDFIYISDVINAITKSLETEDDYYVFNIGSGISFSVKEVVESIIELTNNKVHVVFTNEIREGEVLDSIADISKISSVLNWKPEVSFNEGLFKTIYN